MDDMQRLLIERDVGGLIHALAFHADRRDYEGFAGLFTEQGVLFRPTSAEPLVGREAILNAYRQTPADRGNRHLITNLRIEALSASEARSHAYVTLISTDEQARTGEPYGAPVARFIVGEFHDRCVLTDEGWRMAERRAEFVMNLPVSADSRRTGG